jgi:hypothetical protein
MKLFTLVFIIGLLLSGCVAAQVPGCTDQMATNYNPLATANDGSCTYPPVTKSPVASHDLPDELAETSGLSLAFGDLFTINDNSDNLIYHIGTTNGNIIQTYPLTGISNIDWEEIAHDDQYIYIGDFGNNVNGNRTDLRIYRVSRTSLLNQTPVVDTISFSYSDQTSLAPAGGNNTDFDCEAFWIIGDSIYLATKQWISQKTGIYALPKTPGNYIANLKATLDVDGLVTGATAIVAGPNRLVTLCGYNTLLQPFLYLLYDFQETDFLGGNKRKISIALPFHQIEGITSSDGLKYYLSNEKFVQGSVVNIKQKLHHFDLNDLLLPYMSEVSAVPDVARIQKCSVFPNPANDHVTILLHTGQSPIEYTIVNVVGRIMKQGILSKSRTDIDLADLPAGLYFLSLGNETKVHFKIIRK